MPRLQVGPHLDSNMGFDFFYALRQGSERRCFTGGWRGGGVPVRGGAEIGSTLKGEAACTLVFTAKKTELQPPTQERQQPSGPAHNPIYTQGHIRQTKATCTRDVYTTAQPNTHEGGAMSFTRELVFKGQSRADEAARMVVSGLSALSGERGAGRRRP